MKKYLEQRVEELELEVKLLRAKIKLNEPNGTSKYINNYSKYDPFKDYMHDSNVNSMSETDFPPYPDILSSWDEKNPKDVISDDYQQTIPDWGFVHKFVETDGDFLAWTKSNEAKEAYNISKTKWTENYENHIYRPFKVK